MKILIADDERLIRLGLINMIDELYPYEHTYIEAENGKKLIQKADEFKPELAFIDISMPLMNGLDALKQCKKLSPNTLWIVLSGYSDFEYARTALRLNVFEYLLKPISIEMLEKIMNSALQCINTSLDKFNNNFQYQIITSYNLYQVNTIEEIAPELKNSKDYSLYIFYLDYNSKEKRHSLYRTFIEKMNNVLSKYVSLTFHYSFFFSNTGELCFITRKIHSNEKLVLQIIKKCIAELNSSITTFYRENANIETIFSYCKSINDIASMRIVKGYGEFLLFSDELIELYKSFSPFISELEKLSLSYIQCDEIQYKNSIQKLKTTSLLKKLYSDIDKTSISCYLKDSLGMVLQATDFLGFINSLVLFQNNIFKNTAVVNNNTIEKIKNYIKENYMNDIGINTIAELLDISPNYLSKIFHEKVGTKFIDYLSNLRISNAKKIMFTNKSISVKEVATAVGYRSSRHFTKIFYRIENCLPSEYIKTITNSSTNKETQA